MEDIEKLKSENENLKKIIENKSDLISTTAHKIRTTLTALKWTLRMFLNKDLGDITNEQKEYLEKLIENNEKSLSFINNILISNHTERVDESINLTKINLVELLEKIIFIFSGEIKNKNINLILKKEDIDHFLVKCDEEMVISIFENLVENAIKYSHDNGKIVISIKKDEKENGILVSIEDNGIGIKEGDTSKIFSKFFRATNAIEKENMGSGLGLFTTKSLINKNNGKIWFDSKKEGTTFFVLLPID
jgi:signal transduction histidine kinase